MERKLRKTKKNEMNKIWINIEMKWKEIELKGKKYKNAHTQTTQRTTIISRHTGTTEENKLTLANEMENIKSVEWWSIQLIDVMK